MIIIEEGRSWGSAELHARKTGNRSSLRSPRWNVGFLKAVNDAYHFSTIRTIPHKSSACSDPMPGPRNAVAFLS